MNILRRIFRRRTSEIARLLCEYLYQPEEDDLVIFFVNGKMKHGAVRKIHMVKDVTHGYDPYPVAYTVCEYTCPGMKEYKVDLVYRIPKPCECNKVRVSEIPKPKKKK